MSQASDDRAVEAGRGALFIAFAKVFFMVSGFLQRILLTRLVGPAEYGAFGVINNSISTLNNTIVQGTIQGVSRFTAQDDANADAVKRAGLQLQIIFAALFGGGVVLAAPYLAAFLNAPSYVGWFRLVAAIPVLYSFYSVFVGSANGLRRFRLQASFDVGFSTAKTILLLGGAVIGSRIGQPVTGLFLGFIAAAALILVVSAFKMGLPHGERRFSVWRLFVFMFWVLAYTGLINLALNYDLMLLRKFGGAAVEQTHADTLTGNYEALRTIALLPYQALLVITFVIFPLVSRSTFAEDREATRSYIRQTLRYALMIGVAMAVVMAARPAAILGILYKPEYQQGALALPVLALAVVGLSLISVAGSIVNASGNPLVAVLLLLATVVSGGAAAALLVPAAVPGAEMLLASATANLVGVAVGLTLMLLYLWRRFQASPPLASVVRVAVAAALAIAVGRILPGQGKLMGLATLAVVELVFIAALVILRELGGADRAKLMKILRRR
jgi:stage V sporulation protein B